MAKKKRILLVEDIKSTRETFQSSLELDGYDVTTAGNLKEALAIIQRKNFHVALVDIMLDGEKKTANRDGVEVIKQIHRLNEGTQVIPLTGQDSRTFVSDSYTELGVADFIDKIQGIKAHGWKYAQKKIELAMSRSEIDDAPSWDDLMKNFLLPKEEPLFVDHVARATDGAPFDLLRRTLCSAVRQFQPLIGEVGAVQAFHLDKARNEVIGRFWSKSHGCGVEFVIRKPTTTDPVGGERKQLFERSKGKLEIVVHELSEAERSDFLM
jgi:CheY-like chemotaxis protein